MILRVHGCKDEALKKEIIAASRFYAKELLSKKMLPHIVVDIRMKTRMKDLGSCMVTYFNDWYKAREFEIELKRHQSLESTLSTLAHEFIHLKQFAKGELNDENTKWCGKKINPEVAYDDLPWEIEASLLERVLYHLYIDETTE